MKKSKGGLPKYMTTVTPFSKFLALVVFFTAVIGFFYMGYHYGQVVGMLSCPQNFRLR